MNVTSSRNIPKSLLVLGWAISWVMVYFGAQFLGINPLLVVLGIPLALLVFSRVYYGILVMIFLIPIEVVLTTGSGATVIRIVGLLVMGVWLLDLVIKRRPIYFDRTAFFFVGYAVWALLSVLWSDWPSRVISLGLTYLQLAFFMIVLVDQIDSMKKLKQVILVFVVGGVAAIFLGYFRGEFIGNRLMFSESSGTTLYGYPLAFTMTALGILAMYEKTWMRFLAIGFFLAGIYPVLAVGLQGGILAIILGILAGVLINRPSFSRLFVGVVSAIVVSLIVNYIIQSGILPTALVEHFNIQHTIASGGSGRNRIWALAWELYKQDPLTGIGLNQFPVISARYAIVDFRGRGSHNDFINSLLELGIPGFLLLLSAEFYSIRALLRSIRLSVPNPEWSRILFVIVGLFVAANTGMMLANLLGWKSIWMIFSLVIIASQPRVINAPSILPKKVSLGTR